jgi:hypothetical protein
MKTFSLFVVLFTFFLEFAHAPHAIAEGGGHVGNGGLFIKCGLTPPVLLEYYQSNFSGNHSLVNRANGVGEFFERLKSLDPSFAKLLEDRIQIQGGYATWKQAVQEFSYDELLETPLPEGCRLLQGSIFRENQFPEFVEISAADLDVNQGRLLEIHEALYYLGIHLYGHRNPVATRELIKSLLKDEWDEAQAMSDLNRFKDYANVLSAAQKGKTWEFYGVYGFVGYSTYGQVTNRLNDPEFLSSVCPKFIVAQPTGGWGTQIDLFYESPAGRKVLKSIREGNPGSHFRESRIEDGGDKTILLNSGNPRAISEAYYLHFHRNGTQLKFNYGNNGDLLSWLESTFQRKDKKSDYWFAYETCIYDVDEARYQHNQYFINDRDFLKWARSHTGVQTDDLN